MNRKESLERPFTKTFLLFLLFLFLTLSSSEVNAQDENLAEWFRSQTEWDADTLEALNAEVNEEYIQLTQADRQYSLQDLINRNEFYILWPDFAQRENQFLANSLLQCLVASSHHSADKQIFYALSPFEPYFMSTIMHENLHTDIYQQYPAQTDFLPQGTMAWGFQLLENGSWDSVRLQYVEEAFVAVMSAKLMKDSGFTRFHSYGATYTAGAELLEPILSAAMETQQITLPELWEMHSQSYIVDFFDLLGTQLLANQGQPYDEGQAKLQGYELAVQVDEAIRSQLQAESSGQYALGSTCGMPLRFSQSQMIAFNQQNGLTAQQAEDVWFQDTYTFSDPDYWYIIEENYYWVIGE